MGVGVAADRTVTGATGAKVGSGMVSAGLTGGGTGAAVSGARVSQTPRVQEPRLSLAGQLLQEIRCERQGVGAASILLVDPQAVILRQLVNWLRPVVIDRSDFENLAGLGIKARGLDVDGDVGHLWRDSRQRRFLGGSPVVAAPAPAGALGGLGVGGRW